MLLQQLGVAFRVEFYNFYFSCHNTLHVFKEHFHEGGESSLEHEVLI